MRKIKVRVTYVEELLGTASANKDIFDKFIASNAPDAPSRAEEIEALGVDEVIDKGMTVFSRMADGRPCTWDYQWKGFFKDSCVMLRRADGMKSKNLRAYKKEIDGLVFVARVDEPYPANERRMIPLQLPKGGMVGCCQRPLRASTAQGERVALASSETVPAGTVQEFTIGLLRDDLLPYIIEWLDYGAVHGTGQWRNSGKGCFVYVAFDEDGKCLGGTDTEAVKSAKSKK